MESMLSWLTVCGRRPEQGQLCPADTHTHTCHRGDYVNLFNKAYAICYVVKSGRIYGCINRGNKQTIILGLCCTPAVTWNRRGIKWTRVIPVWWLLNHVIQCQYHEPARKSSFVLTFVNECLFWMNRQLSVQCCNMWNADGQFIFATSLFVHTCSLSYFSYFRVRFYNSWNVSCGHHLFLSSYI